MSRQSNTAVNPYPYQRECLDALALARTEGRDKALVVMATGLGKTVFSAFEIKGRPTGFGGIMKFLESALDLLLDLLMAAVGAALLFVGIPVVIFFMVWIQASLLG